VSRHRDSPAPFAMVKPSRPPPHKQSPILRNLWLLSDAGTCYIKAATDPVAMHSSAQRPGVSVRRGRKRWVSSKVPSTPLQPRQSRRSALPLASTCETARIPGDANPPETGPFALCRQKFKGLRVIVQFVRSV
jgi:hypothetical protein